MFEVINESRKKYLDSYTGRVMDVLFERECEPGVYEGKTMNYIHIKVKCDKDISGEILNVKINSNDSMICFGKICD